MIVVINNIIARANLILLSLFLCLPLTNLALHEYELLFFQAGGLLFGFFYRR